jgi:VWFA-related protein
MLGAMLSHCRRVAFALAWAVVVAAGLHAQERSGPPPEAIAIDFFAVGPEGSVFDLRPDEVSLKLDGRARPIRSLRYVNLPYRDPNRPPAEAPVDLDPPFGSNALTPDARWVTIVLDHESIRAGTERNAINTTIRYVRMLGPRDRVAYVRMPNGGVEIDFTTNHDQVVDALRNFRATAPRDPTEQERSCRSRLLLNTLSEYIRGLTPIQGPKSVVVVSTGVLNPRRDAPMLGPPGPCEIRQIYFQEVSTAASMARAHLFVVQPDDVTMDSPRTVFTDRTASRFAGADEDRAGLESLAGVTGGDFMRVVGPDDPTLTNVAGGLTGYYIATFDVNPPERNGAMHRVEVSVSRERVRVRTNPEVHLPRHEGKAVNASAETMLRNGLLYRGLPIRATAFTSAGDGGRVKILAVLEGLERDVKFKEAVFGLIDVRRGKLVAQWTANEDERAGSQVITAGAGAPGPYRLRVAAIDVSGRRGTAEYEFAAELTPADPLSVSAMALGVSRDGSFSPKLVFGTDQAAVAYFEAYGQVSGPDAVTARLEVAASPEGRAIVTAAPRVVPQGALRRQVIGALPIAALAPGDYVVRAIVSVDGRPVGRIMRTLRKSTSGS